MQTIQTCCYCHHSWYRTPPSLLLPLPGVLVLILVLLLITPSIILSSWHHIQQAASYAVPPHQISHITWRVCWT
jgi:hypothetical protein